MSEIPFNTQRTRGVLYGLICLSSFVVFGNVAEVCDTNNTCPTRQALVIAIGVIASVISGVLCAASLFEIESILHLESILAIALLALYSICVAIVSSVRTGLGTRIAISFAWVAEVLSFLLVFAALTADGGPLASKGGSGRRGDVESRGEEVPEEEYMKEMGTEAIRTAPVTSVGVPMVPLEESDRVPRSVGQVPEGEQVPMTPLVASDVMSDDGGVAAAPVVQVPMTPLQPVGSASGI